MYCKYCGKQIEEDSLYCKFCGENLNDVTKAQKVIAPRTELLEWFKSLSLKVQILIIIYIAYLLSLICYLSYSLANGYEEAFGEVIILGLIIPFVLISGYYFWKRYKENKSVSIKKDILPSNTSKETEVNVEPNKSLEVSLRTKVIESNVPSKKLKGTEPLLLFAKSHGKMQLVKKAISETNATEHYCLFEDSEGNAVNVFFAKEVGILSAEDISKNKYKLCVKEYIDGIFELDYMEDNDSDELPL